jgi:hypothetical protein
MSKPEITVTCYFTDEGEAARPIISRSFAFFLQRELMQNSRKLALQTPFHV